MNKNIFKLIRCPKCKSDKLLLKIDESIGENIIGGRLSVKRHVENATGVDYDALLSKEHVNRCSDILVTLKNYFFIEKLVGVPFRFPSVNLNIFLVGRCIKEQDYERQRS